MTDDHERLLHDALHDGRVTPYRLPYWREALATDPDAAAALADLKPVVPLGKIGYGSKHEAFDLDPWDWFDARPPDLTLRCTTTGDLLGRVWRAPDGHLWCRTGSTQKPLDEAQLDSGRIPLVCPHHGIVLMTRSRLEDATRRRKTTKAPCLGERE